MYSIEVCRGATRSVSVSIYAAMSSFCADWMMRFQVSSSVAISSLHSLPLPSSWSILQRAAEALFQAPSEASRVPRRCMLDAIVAVLYGLDRDDFAWILRDCDHPAARLSEKGFCRTLDPKGFWRVDKASDPELRHTVLSLAAFDDLHAAIGLAGLRDAGIQAFCDQNDGDGWTLPESLCLAELGLTRSVDVGVYDERAMVAQPVRARMGERFLDWQLAQTVEESWAECEGHARAILEGSARSELPPKPQAPRDLGPLFRPR